MNRLAVKISGIEDSLAPVPLLTSEGRIQFREVYLMNELIPLLQEVNKIINNTDKQLPGNVQYNLKKDSPKIRLGDLLDSNFQQPDTRPVPAILLDFSQAYNDNGRLGYPPMIGTVRVSDTAQVRKLFQEEALEQLTPSTALFFYGIPEKESEDKNHEQKVPLYFIHTRGNPNKAVLENEDIIDVSFDFNQLGKPAISFQLKASASRKWQVMTGSNIGRPIAIIFNGMVISAPNVESAIEGGSSIINGDFTVEECKSISRQLKTKPLPAAVTILSSEVQVVANKAATLRKWLIPLLSFLLATSLAFFVFKTLKST